MNKAFLYGADNLVSKINGLLSCAGPNSTINIRFNSHICLQIM